MIVVMLFRLYYYETFHCYSCNLLYFLESVKTILPDLKITSVTTARGSWESGKGSSDIDLLVDPDALIASRLRILLIITSALAHLIPSSSSLFVFELPNAWTRFTYSPLWSPSICYSNLELFLKLLYAVKVIAYQ